MTQTLPDERAARPRISGHRGALAVEPENTIRSFRRAIADGAAVVELDLHRSADGALVVMHDATVDRTTDGTGAVNDLDLAAIAGLSAGGERVPTFPEVLAAVEAPIQVEVKDPLAVEPLVELLADLPESAARLVLSSFSEEIVRRLAAALPGVPRGLITHRYEEGLDARQRALGSSVAYCGWEGLTETAVRSLHEAGLLVTVWPVNTHEEVERALALGVDEISCNDPGEVASWLR
ncbi:glycerophosphodiester phosphodiesterase [Pseudactinotalea suaedae]|uniref:glycerophosphodiester phosphodiesterase n=1 Tax=Pseudactinotalea suaedae TaxID=1524924 RepID=UPI00139201F9|nr:glycerophosphodiester phosphodiesterase family protein [Pseudactinotalea suaedae]